MEPFTVIVPALNCCGALEHTLESCVVQRDDNFRILVCDNHSTDATRDVIGMFQNRDPRVAHLMPPLKLEDLAHDAFALTLARDGFVMLLKPGDALLPGAIARAHGCLQQHPQTRAMLGGPMAQYYGPDFDAPLAGILRISHDFDQGSRSAREWLDRAGRGECDAMDLPNPCRRAFVHASIVNGLLQRTRQGMRLESPGIHLSVAIGAMIEEYQVVCPGFSLIGMMREGDDSRRTGEDRPGRDQIVLGACLCEARDTGILPPMFAIHWERIIARACRQARLDRREDSEWTADLTHLNSMAKSIGCREASDAIERLVSCAYTKEQNRLLNDPSFRTWPVKIDTRPLQVTRVHQAARVAELLQQGFIDAGDTQGSIPHHDFSWRLGQVILQMAERTSELLRVTQAVRNELARRKTELLRYETKLAEATGRMAELRARLEEA